MGFASKRDENNVAAIFGVSSIDLKTPTSIKVNPATGAILIDSASLGIEITTSIYVKTTGNDSNDGLSWATAKLTIPSAIAALPANGGIVKIGAGVFSVVSSSRTDTISYASGNTFNDTSITSGDVGKYVLWSNLGRVAKITSVSAGVSFVVDVLPTTTSAISAKIITPGIVVPEGVTIEGVGSNFNQQLTAGGSTSQVCTQISDSGTGVTILIRGANSVSGNATRYGVSKLSCLGNSGNMFGLFVGNGAWYVESNDLELSSHGIAGLALDGNINSHDFRNLIMYGNGNASASTPTGGILTHPYNVGGSASCNIYNAFFTSNIGFGICDGDSAGSYGVVLWSPQFNSQQASAMANSGSSMVLQSNNYGRAVVFGGWSESAAAFDVITSGDVTITGMRLHSTYTYHWLVVGGTSYAENCSFSGASLFSIHLTAGGVITWNAVDCTDPGFYSGVPSPLPSMGSSATISANSLIANGGTINGNLTVEDASTPTKAYKFQTSGASLDFIFAGAQFYFSGYPNPNFTGTQQFYLAADTSGDLDAFGVWRFHTAPFASTIITIDPSSSTPLTVAGAISATELDSNTSTPGSIAASNSINTAASGASFAGFYAQVEPGSTGDPYFQFSINGVTDWIMGADNSDADKFKISYSTDSGTNTAFTIDTSGRVGIGKISAYNGIATAGQGVPAIYGQGRSTAQTAAVASIATYTVGAADGSFLISANILVSASVTHSFSCTCTYTDEGGTSRTLTLNFSQLTGAFVTTITNILGASAYEGVPVHIRAKAATSITIATTGTFTSVTYNVEGVIQQIA